MGLLVTRIAGDADPNEGGLKKPKNVEAQLAILCGYGPTPEAGERKLIGVAVSDDGKVQTESASSGGAVNIAGTYNSAQPAVTSGNQASLQLDSGANLLTQLGKPQPSNRATVSSYSRADDTDPNATHALVKGTFGNVLSVDASNAEATGFWLMLFDTGGDPNNGDTPFFRKYVPPGSTVGAGREFFSEAGRFCATGIGFAFSSTVTTLTRIVASEVAVNLQYI